VTRIPALGHRPHDALDQLEVGGVGCREPEPHAGGFIPTPQRVQGHGGRLERNGRDAVDRENFDCFVEYLSRRRTRRAQRRHQTSPRHGAPTVRGNAVARRLDCKLAPPVAQMILAPTLEPELRPRLLNAGRELVRRAIEIVRRHRSDRLTHAQVTPEHEVRFELHVSRRPGHSPENDLVRAEELALLSKIREGERGVGVE